MAFALPAQLAFELRGAVNYLRGMEQYYKRLADAAEDDYQKLFPAAVQPGGYGSQTDEDRAAANRRPRRRRKVWRPRRRSRPQKESKGEARSPDGLSLQQREETARAWVQTRGLERMPNRVLATVYSFLDDTEHRRHLRIVMSLRPEDMVDEEEFRAIPNFIAEWKLAISKKQPTHVGERGGAAAPSQLRLPPGLERIVGEDLQ